VIVYECLYKKSSPLKWTRLLGTPAG